VVDKVPVLVDVTLTDWVLVVAPLTVGSDVCV
jgi:hypothetical protein